MTPLAPRERIELAATATLGLLLRFVGIDWGLPRIDLNPDEMNVLNITERISWSSLDPQFYNYSGLTFHLNFLAGQLAGIFGYGDVPVQQLLVNRLLAVAFATATVALTYLAARRLLGDGRGPVLAALFMAVAPLHVWDAHFATSDMGLVFWTTLAFHLGLVAYERQRLGVYLLGGAAVGLAIATKFNGALAGATFIAAAAAGAWRGRVAWSVAARNLAAAGAMSLVVFALASPYSIAHLAETVEAFRYETRHVSGGHHGFDLTAVGWQYHRGLYQLVAAFPFSFGFALYGAVLAGIVGSWRRRDWTGRALLWAFPVLYLYATFSWIFVPLRYYLPVFPMLLIMTADTFDAGLGSTRRTARRVTVGLLAVVLAYTIVFTLTSTWRFTDDTRLQAGRWIDTELPRDSRLALVETRFARSYMPIWTREDIEAQTVRDFGARTMRPFLWEAEGDGLLVVSGLTFWRDYRQGDPEVIEAWNLVRDNPKRFELVRRFDSWFLNKDLYTALDPMYDGYFVSPTIELWRPLQPRNRAADPDE